MKTLVALTVAVTGIFGGAGAFAQTHHDSYRIAYESRDRDHGDRDHGDRLEWRINHLNRMVDHVRWEARRYHADWRVRRELQDISRDVDRLTRRYHSGDYNGWRLRRDVDQQRDRLHAIETRLRARSGDFYRWD